MSEIKGYTKGLAFLTLAALFVKVLSMVYRIPFQNLVGDQGFFIYQQVYPFIAIFMTWTSSGLAIAISKLIVDESYQTLARQKAVSQLIYRALWILSLILFALMYMSANYFAQAMGDPHLTNLLKIGAIVIFTVPTLAMYKGRLQASGQLQTVAKIQVIEQVTRVAFILIGTAYVMRTSKSLYLAGEVAIWGTVSGEIIGVLLLVIYMKKSGGATSLIKKEERVTEKTDFLKKLLVVSVSASMSSLLLIMFQLVDSFTVYDTLIKNMRDPLQAMIEKGIYDRGQPLVQVGLVIATSLSMAIVPMLANAMKRQQHKKIEAFIKVTYKVSLLFGLAASLGLILVMPYLNKALFETSDLSDVLSIYSLQIIMLSIIMALTAVLQGLGYRKWPTYILATSLLIKIATNSLAVHLFGIAGAAWASNIALFIAVLSLIYYLKKVRQMKLADFHFYKTMLLASLIMVVITTIFTNLIELNTILPDNRIRAVLIVIGIALLGASVFVLWITKFKIFTIKEWVMLPLGSKVAKLQLFLNRKKVD